MDLAFAAAYARLREAHLAQDVSRKHFCRPIATSHAAPRANPLARDPSGRTALDWAVLQGWQEVVAALRGEAPVWNLAVEPAHTSELRGWLGRVLDAGGTALGGPCPTPVPAVRPYQAAILQVQSPTGPMFETDIKALGLLAPVSRGGAAWLRPRGGVGLMVLLAAR